ncbi:MAG: rubrerythrin family protein [Chloroflexi bacterium]|nr:rubrerythrin family protein [Chloroflexota bacterium]
MKSTLENLKEAFAGESQAVQKYRVYAEKAEHEGFVNIARLFRAAAEAERIHAHEHFKAMDGIGSTVENLQDAIEGEKYETEVMYPPMLEQAQADSHRAKRMFGYAMEAEATHARLYQMAWDAAENEKDLAETDFYLCPICGYIEAGKPSAVCPICGTKPDKFIKV